MAQPEPAAALLQQLGEGEPDDDSIYRSDAFRMQCMKVGRGGGGLRGGRRAEARAHDGGACW